MFSKTSKVRLLCGFLIGIILVSALAVQVFQWGLEIQPEKAFQEPSLQNLFGTDSLGRSLLARILQGCLVSCAIATGAVCLSSAIGTFFGFISGWTQGILDRLIMRILDMLSALPNILLATVLAYGLLQSGIQDFYVLVLTLGVTRWMTLARLVRARVIELKEKPFIEAAVALGGSPSHIFKTHLVSHLAAMVFLQMAIQFPVLLTTESFLSFIGIGIQSPLTSWGLLIGEGWKYMSSIPYLILAPSSFLFFFLIIFKIAISPSSSLKN